MIQKTKRRTLTLVIGFFLMYAGFALLLLPMIVSNEPISLSDNPQFFSFEDDLSSVNSIINTPEIITSPVASGNKAIECQNNDYVRWNLAKPSRTIDLTFKIFWTKLPTSANQSLNFAQILELEAGTWRDIISTNLYCDQNNYRGWMIWTGIPTGKGDFVSADVVNSLQTNHWYTVRLIANLNTGTYELYMNTLRLASIKDAKVPTDVYIDFFRLGTGAKGDDNVTTYFDDITVSLLDQPPPPQKWSIKITSSLGGQTSLNGTIILNEDEALTLNAIQNPGYVFSNWIFDGTQYSTNSEVTIPAQIIGTQHTIHAKFKNTSSDFDPNHNWLPFQGIGLTGAVIGGYILWSHKKQESTNTEKIISGYQFSIIFLNL